VALLLSGCFAADEPSKDHIKLALEPRLTRDVPLEIVKVESKWIKTGEARLESKALVSLRLKEDLFVSATLNDALAVLKLTSAETALLRQALAQVGAQAEPLRSSLLEKAPESLEGQQFISLAEKAGATLSAEVSLLARKGVDGWNMEIQHVSSSSTLNGRPRSAMPAGALAVGSPEAKKLIQDGIEAIRRLGGQDSCRHGQGAGRGKRAKAQGFAHGHQAGRDIYGHAGRPSDQVGERSGHSDRRSAG